MIATVKIIPFAVTEKARDDAVMAANAARPLVRVAPYRIRKVGVVSTVLPGLATKVIEKTLKVTEERLRPAGAGIVADSNPAAEYEETRDKARAVVRALELAQQGL